MAEHGSPGEPAGLISSTRNARVKWARKLGSKKHRRIEGRLLVEGVRTAAAAVAAGLAFDALFCTLDFLGRDENAAVVAGAHGLGAEVLPVTDEVLDSVTTVTSSPGMVGIVRAPAWSLRDVFARGEDSVRQHGRSVLLWLDRVSDPGNLGTIIRSAHGLGAAGYFASPGTVETFNPRAVRSAAGASFLLPGVSGVTLEDILEQAPEYSLMAAVPRGGVPLHGVDPPARCLLLVGEEAGGLSPEAESVARLLVTVPMTDEAESLNVAAASAIILYHLSPLTG